VAILNTLETLDADGSNRFAHRVDTQRAGTLGFSFGGGVAAEASRLDPRIKAVVNLDGRHWGEALYRGVERPYLFISEELRMPTAAELTSPDGAIRYEAMLDQVDYPNLDANMRAHGGVRISIAGTAHMNFTDVPLRSPIRRFTFGGSIDAHRAQEIVQTYVVEFFSRCLLSEEQPPLNSAWAQYPETRVQVWPAAASP
jgi:dienelactone hydrolase